MKTTWLYLLAGLVLLIFLGFLIYWRVFEVATGIPWANF